jgi:hypothetical protein
MTKQISMQLESLSSLLYTLAITQFFISFTKYYREIRAVDITIVSTPVTRANSGNTVIQRELLSLYGFCKAYNKMKNV